MSTMCTICNRGLPPTGQQAPPGNALYYSMRLKESPCTPLLPRRFVRRYLGGSSAREWEKGHGCGISADSVGCRAGIIGGRLHFAIPTPVTQGIAETWLKIQGRSFQAAIARLGDARPCQDGHYGLGRRKTSLGCCRGVSVGAGAAVNFPPAAQRLAAWPVGFFLGDHRNDVI